MSANRIILYDFHDSFTMNVYDKLLIYFDNVEVIDNINDILDDLRNIQFICWGPGPGHPKEYHKERDLIKLIFHRCPQIFQFGICLGHQLMLHVLNYKVSNSIKPIHGQNTPMIIPSWPVFSKKFVGEKIFVQRYNSLNCYYNNQLMSKYIENIYKDEDEQIQMVKYKNGLSYQFHPESIGTSCPEVFFDAMKNSFYNR